MRRSLRTSGFASSLLLACVLAVPVPADAQLPPAPDDPALMEAYLAWDRGEYPAALRGYLDVLDSTDDPEVVREIAHLTGEVYAVTELAPDGRNLGIAPDGRTVTFEVTEGEATVTKLVEVETGRLLASYEGSGAVPGPGGATLLLELGESDEVDQARLALTGARGSGDRGRIMQAMRQLGVAQARATDAVLRTGPGADPVVIDLEQFLFGAAAWSPDGADLWILGATPNGQAGLVRVRDGVVAERLSMPPVQAGGLIVARDEILVPLQPRGIARVRDGQLVGVIEDATSPALSPDGTVLTYLIRLEDGRAGVGVANLATGEAATLHETDRDVADPAISPDGARVAFQERVVDDWEIFTVPADASEEPTQLTWEIQHDLYPTWVDGSTVLAAKGEGRHRRSYLYDIEGGEPLKLFHNNTIRTIAPEYEWVVSPDGSTVVLVSERDGDTVSEERAVYAVHLDRPVGKEEVAARLEGMLAAEEDLRERGRRAFEPIADDVRRVTEQVDVTRIYLAARDLYRMGSKHITQPGNALAIDYYVEKLRSYGYEPELQWFEPREGIRTANVVARLEGTRDPELVYVVSSHFDSTQRGPGADDDTSGGTALLEAARVMKDHPQPTTIEFAFFTGEEAGLLGSREYVRRAVEEGKAIVGALNNDMVGWANDHRLDNTIRYSNPGIRDIQHAAAMQFSDLITYDALYYKSTDAHAYYEEYGDIVGGIGSYPVLGSPHYHQFTDRLPTIEQRLVQAVSQTTVATLMMLTHVPARVKGVTLGEHDGDVTVEWDASPESNVRRYRIEWTTPDGETGDKTMAHSAGMRHALRLEPLPAGTEVTVIAVNDRDMQGWDHARATVE